MKTIGIAFLFLLFTLVSNGQMIKTKTDSVKLSVLTVLDSTFFKRIDDLSMKTDYPLNLFDGKPSKIFLFIEADHENMASYYIRIGVKKEYDYLHFFSGFYGFFPSYPKAWGFFEMGGKVFTIIGDNIPDIFQVTNKIQTIIYTYKSDVFGRIVSSWIPSSKKTIEDIYDDLVFLYIYSNGRVEFEKIY